MRTATTARARLCRGVVSIQGALVMLFFPAAASVGGTGCGGDDNSAGTKMPSQDASTSTDAQTGGGQEAAAGDDSSGGGGSVGDSSMPGDAGSVVDAPSRSPSGDAAACVQSDPTHWIYMCDPSQCDNHPGIPCGYTATNGGQGYTCGCEFPSDKEPWGCQPPDAGVGKACANADAGHD